MPDADPDGAFQRSPVITNNEGIMKHPAIRKLFAQSSIVLLSALIVATAQAQYKPNIVLLFADNFGYGELGSYGGGITRGAPTPRLDALAREGTRLTNFNVEPSCTPSRSALMVGRHPIRDGTYSVPVDGKPYGLVQWEITLPKLLSQVGYATALYGKWHLGDSDGRYPPDQGFDEWYGIPNSSDESIWPQEPNFDPKFAHFEYVMEGRRGEKTHQVKLYNAEARREIDDELTDRTVDFNAAQREGGQAVLRLRSVRAAAYADRGLEGVHRQDWQRTLRRHARRDGFQLRADHRRGVGSQHRGQHDRYLQ